MFKNMDLVDGLFIMSTVAQEEDDEDGWMDGWMDGRMNRPNDRQTG